METQKQYLAGLLLFFFGILLTSCTLESETEIPEPIETYVFPFKTEINALKIYYPPSVDRSIYMDAEKCSDDMKRDIRAVISPLSNEQLIAMGNQMHHKYFASSITTHGKMSWAREILENMKPFLVENQYPYQLHVIEGDYFNAFTIPGGNIYVTTGMLDMVQSKDELAFIIGHELGHNENDHTRESARTIRYGEKLEKEWGLIGSLLGLATNFFDRTCGKSDELECDIASFYLLHKAGYDPEKALEGISLLKTVSTPKAQDPLTQLMWIILGSHPWSEDRYDIAFSYVKQAKVNATCEEVFSGRMGKVITKRDPLTLRALPSKHSTGKKIPKGADIEVICDCIKQEYQIERDWLYVKYFDQDSIHYGWVDKQYVYF